MVLTNQIAISGCVGSDQLDEFGRRLRQRGLAEELHPAGALGARRVCVLKAVIVRIGERPIY